MPTCYIKPILRAMSSHDGSSYADGKSAEAYLTTFWVSKKQSFVSTSSTIAEFCDLAANIKEAIWLKELTVAIVLEKV